MEKTPGERIAELYILKKKLTKANQIVKELKELKSAADIQMINMLEEELKLTFVGGESHRAALNIDVVPDVYDWGEFGEFIITTKSLYMLERRPSVPAFRETLEARGGENIPGVRPFNRKTISLRKL